MFQLWEKRPLCKRIVGISAELQKEMLPRQALSGKVTKAKISGI
jgi:hypothetical protein